MSKYNFLSFLQEYKSIKIPPLQRDYAQGRISKRSVAEDFLDSIFEVLKDSSKKLHIDFIYGYKDENNNFVLIDGQQRITTLWLLHFLLYKQSNSIDSIKNILSNFSYSVRESSKQFCKNLINKNDRLIISDNDVKNSIISMVGVFAENEDLENDPTIKAMLNMLNWIYNRMRDIDNLENYKTNLNNITFSVFNMKDSNLNDEIYIKMNARGKQLSKYENIKAYIEKDLDQKEYYKLFSSIDNNWSNYFFDNKDLSLFDKRGLLFLYYSAVFFYMKEKNDKNYFIDNIYNNIKYDFFDILKDYDKLSILDSLIKILSNPDLNILNNFVKKFNGNNLSRKDICYFFALLFFVIKLKNIDFFNKEYFCDYYRVCKHLIENHRLDKQLHIESFFELLDKISNGYDNIYKYLSDTKENSSFHTSFYNLEKKKAYYILESRNGKNDWESIFNELSDNSFIIGWTEFLFSFSTNNEEVDFDTFSKYSLLTLEIVNSSMDDKDDFFVTFLRALLVFGDYSFWNTNYYYGNKFNTHMRDRELWFNNIFINKNIFKNLLDKLLEMDDTLSLKSKLDMIIDNCELENSRYWFEYLLIKNPHFFHNLRPSLQDALKIGRIYKNGDDIILLPTIKGKKEAIDLFSYSFYLYIIEKLEKLKREDISLSDFNINYITFDRVSRKRNPQKKCCYFTITINNKEKKVICESIEQRITIGTKKYNINLENPNNIYIEYETILKDIL